MEEIKTKDTYGRVIFGLEANEENGIESNNNVKKMENGLTDILPEDAPEHTEDTFTIVHDSLLESDDNMEQNPSENSLVDALNIETRPSFSRRLSRSSSSTVEFMSNFRRKNSSDWFATTTEHIMNKHAYKSQLSRLLKSMDQAFTYMQTGKKEGFIQGIEILVRRNEEVWRIPKIGFDLIDGMCDYFRRSGNLDLAIQTFIENKIGIQTQIAELLDAYMSNGNRDYLVQAGYCNDFIKTVIGYTCDSREHRRQIGLGLLETFFAISSDVCKTIVQLGALEILLQTCKSNFKAETLLNAAVCLSNLALFGGHCMRQEMVDQQIANWLFVLANHNDERLRYYSCLTICILASERDLEVKVDKSGTLVFVESFLKQFVPNYIAKLDSKFRCGRSSQWLMALSQLLQSSRSEVKALATFQLAMEASLRKGLNSIKIFEEIGVVNIIRELASCPCNQLAANFATEILETIGEPVPHRLTQSVPLWSIDDVHFWVTQIGFGEVARNFLQYRVDGDLLLKTTDQHLINEIGLTSMYERMRFTRELNSLKCSADYSALDQTRLDLWLIQLDKEFSVYTYQLLNVGVDRTTLIHLNDELLKNECMITNGIHRTKILHAIQDVKHVEDLDIALLRKHVDIFICYRRSTGSQLASLLKVHLQLRGYKVFIDVDRLYAGQFDTSLLKNIRAAKHFLLVLTPHSLDRCVDDFDCKDWVHTEIRTALEAGRNIVPVQDKNFEWPETYRLPTDVRPICYFNAVHWVHEYQEACVEKLDKFLKGESETTPDEMSDTVGPLLSHPPKALRADSLTFSTGQTETDSDVALLIKRRVSN